MALPPASGTGQYFVRAAKSIRLVRQGCTNRPFFHISVTHIHYELRPLFQCLYWVENKPMPEAERLINKFILPTFRFVGDRTARARMFLKRPNHLPVIEQLGSYDPMPNVNNEKLVALNLERLKHWLGKGAHVTKPVAELLGLSGFFPIHPRSYMTAWRNRAAEREALAKQEAEAAKVESTA